MWSVNNIQDAIDELKGYFEQRRPYEQYKGQLEESYNAFKQAHIDKQKPSNFVEAAKRFLGLEKAKKTFKDALEYVEAHRHYKRFVADHLPESYAYTPAVNKEADRIFKIAERVIKWEIEQMKTTHIG